jgi:hypothetical protein
VSITRWVQTHEPPHGLTSSVPPLPSLEATYLTDPDALGENTPKIVGRVDATAFSRYAPIRYK